MKKRFNIYFLVILGLLWALIPSACLGNSAEPPSLLIIVKNAPADLEISLMSTDNTMIPSSVRGKGNEKYYTFYRRDFRQVSDDKLIITSGGKQDKLRIPRPLDEYRNILSLDLDTMTIEKGKLLSRSILLVSSRVTITLLIEGLLFFVMGYREKRSWIAFFIINLVTQGLLNIWLNSFSPVASYLIVNLIVGEFMVYIFELIAFVNIVEEDGKGKLALYVILANTLSLMMGSYVIEHLPI